MPEPQIELVRLHFCPAIDLATGHGLALPVHLTLCRCLNNIAGPSHPRTEEKSACGFNACRTHHTEWTVTVKIPASHGWLEAALKEPDGRLRGAAVVCHPHPVYGRHHAHEGGLSSCPGLERSGVGRASLQLPGAGADGASMRASASRRTCARPSTGWRDDTPTLPMVTGGHSFGSWVGLSVGAEMREWWRFRPGPAGGQGGVRLRLPPEVTTSRSWWFRVSWTSSDRGLVSRSAPPAGRAQSHWCASRVRTISSLIDSMN